MEKQSLIKKFYSDDFKITAKGKWYAIAPLAIIMIGVLVIAIWNFNLGLDFTGGRIINVRGFSDYSAAETQVRQILSAEDGMNMRAVQIQEEISLTHGSTMSVRFQDISGADMDVVSARIADAIRNSNHAALAGAIVEPATTITGATSQDRIMNTIYAVVIALFGILVYMLFRFKLTSGISTVIGLIHDVLVMMALTAIFQIQINAPFIAALITVIAYSINNTLILFDRVRTHEKHNEGRLPIEQIVDKSVKETFARTMNTTITTLVPIFVLIVAGVPLIREFAIPIMFGLIAGTFSTIFVTTSLYVRFEKHQARRRKALATKTSTSKT